MSSTRGSWNGNPNGNWWGLVQKKGPWNETEEDRKRAKDRGGYPHAGHANWYSRLNPGPYIQTKRPSKPFYQSDKSTVLQEDTNYKGKQSRRMNATVPSRSVYDRAIQSIVGPLQIKKPVPVEFSSGIDVFKPNNLPKEIIPEKMSKDLNKDSTLYPNKLHRDHRPAPLNLAFSHPIVQVPEITAVRADSAPTRSPTIAPNQSISQQGTPLEPEQASSAIQVEPALEKDITGDQRPEDDASQQTLQNTTSDPLGGREYKTPAPTEASGTTMIATRHTDEKKVPGIARRKFNQYTL